MASRLRRAVGATTLAGADWRLRARMQTPSLVFRRLRKVRVQTLWSRTNSRVREGDGIFSSLGSRSAVYQRTCQ
jgi:hypothetical protein